MDPPCSDPQHEWYRIIVSDDDMFFVRYTTRKLDEVEVVRPIWEEKLSQAYLGDMETLY